jgi:choline-sulfatase/uncharacterized sulfatase
MPDRPNIVWIMADQHNAKCTSWGSHPSDARTPNLERLCETGTRFSRAFTQNPICSPSRTSYLTGQYPSNHGQYAITQYGATSVHPAPHLFSITSQLGYRTGAFGKIHTPTGLIEDDVDRMRATSMHPTKEGEEIYRDSAYTEYLQSKGVLEDRDDREIGDPNASMDIWEGLDGRPSRLPFEDQPEYWAVDQAQEFVSDAGDDPFCLWLTFDRPHQAYTPPQEFWDMYSDDELELPPSADEDLSDKPPTQQRTRAAQEAGDSAVFDPQTYKANRRRVLRGYLGCVSMVDACVGRMLDFLEAEGLREDTIVIYCADHGDFAGEHGILEKAPGISYDAITRIPYIWSWPGHIQENEEQDELVETVDMLPTLLDLIGGPRAESADGQNITGMLTGDDTNPVREYAVTENPWAKCVRTKNQKLTVYPREFFGADSEEFLEGYDLEDDPWEMHNVAAETSDSELIDRHRRHLCDFLATNRRPISVMGFGNAIPDEESDTRITDGRINPNALRDYAREEGSYKNYL